MSWTPGVLPDDPADEQEDPLVEVHVSQAVMGVAPEVEAATI